MAACDLCEGNDERGDRIRVGRRQRQMGIRDRLALGVMTRAAPQLNIFSVGFPVTMFLGFIIIMLILPGILPRFNKMMLEAMQLSQSIGGL